MIDDMAENDWRHAKLGHARDSAPAKIVRGPMIEAEPLLRFGNRLGDGVGRQRPVAFIVGE
jgi:hypothetical protein